MHPLVLHPACTDGPIHRVSASVAATPEGCRARFRLKGEVGRIKLPAHALSERMDELWRTTCFEIFWQPNGGSAYREFNLSPSSRWACYDFDDVRLNGRNAPVSAIAIAFAVTNASLDVDASIASELPLPASVALNAIVEDLDGNIQFWALAFADGKPDFHNPVCRALTLETPA